MRERAPRGQRFLLQLPGGLGPLDTHRLADMGLAGLELQARVSAAQAAKTRGDAAVRAGDWVTAQREYAAGLDQVRAQAASMLLCILEAWAVPAVMVHALQLNDPRCIVLWTAQLRSTPAAHALAALYPYIPEHAQAVDAFVAQLQGQAGKAGSGGGGGGGGSSSKKSSKTDKFWSQLTAHHLQLMPGGADGPIARPVLWPHCRPLEVNMEIEQ
jgi:hypothetical protein